MFKAEASLARTEWGPRLSRDGVLGLSERASSSEAELERVWAGDEAKERELSRGGLCRRRSKLLLSIAEVDDVRRS
jgi:hypothetical protein